MSDDLNDLKPCPFCNAPAVLEDATGPNAGGRMVMCGTCLASSAVMFPAMDASDEALKAAWNRRVPSWGAAAGSVEVVLVLPDGTRVPLVTDAVAFWPAGVQIEVTGPRPLPGPPTRSTEPTFVDRRLERAGVVPDTERIRRRVRNRHARR